MLSSREIVDGLLRRRPVPRMAVNDHPWGDTLRQWAEREGYPRNAAGHPVSPVQYFGFDLECVGGWLDMLPKRGAATVVEETAEWKLVRNGAGALLRWWKQKSGTPEHVAFTMNSRAVWEHEYRPHLLAVDRARLNLEAARASLARCRAQGLWTFYGSLFLWELLRCSLGDVAMFEALALDRGWIHDYNRVYTDFFKAHYRVLLEEAGKPDGIWIYEDLGYRNGLYCSPRMLEDLIFPYYREVVEFFHSYDLPVVLHSCGCVNDAVPLVAQAGFDGLNPMEAKAGCRLLEFAEKYGDRLAFFGGLDARVLESGDRERIRRAVVEQLTALKARGARYCFGSDHSLSTNVRLADFQYALAVYHEHGWY